MAHKKHKAERRREEKLRFVQAAGTMADRREPTPDPTRGLFGATTQPEPLPDANNRQRSLINPSDRNFAAQTFPELKKITRLPRLAESMTFDQFWELMFFLKENDFQLVFDHSSAKKSLEAGQFPAYIAMVESVDLANLFHGKTAQAGSIASPQHSVFGTAQALGRVPDFFDGLLPLIPSLDSAWARKHTKALAYILSQSPENFFEALLQTMERRGEKLCLSELLDGNNPSHLSPDFLPGNITTERLWAVMTRLENNLMGYTGPEEWLHIRCCANVPVFAHLISEADPARTRVILDRLARCAKPLHANALERWLLAPALAAGSFIDLFRLPLLLGEHLSARDVTLPPSLSVKEAVQKILDSINATSPAIWRENAEEVLAVAAKLAREHIPTIRLALSARHIRHKRQALDVAAP